MIIEKHKRALNCCFSDVRDCGNCDYCEEYNYPKCKMNAKKDIINTLVNQQAEIERLRKQVAEFESERSRNEKV